MFEQQTGWLLFASFFILSASDYIDGIIARKNGPTTSGAFLDPLADKILAIGAFFVLAMGGFYIWLPIIIMAVREIVKTLIQMLAVGLVIFPPLKDFDQFHGIMLWVACVLSVISGIDLFINAQKAVEENKSHSE